MKFFYVLLIVCFAILIGSAALGSREEQEFRVVCKVLDAQFVDADGWKCIKDKEIVYP